MIKGAALPFLEDMRVIDTAGPSRVTMTHGDHGSFELDEPVYSDSPSNGGIARTIRATRCPAPPACDRKAAMGLLTRTLVPRSLRRAAHPARTVRRAVTPRPVKQAQRALHPVSNAAYSVERSLNTKPWTRKAQTEQASQGEKLMNMRLDRLIPLAVAFVVTFVICGLVFGWAAVISTVVVGGYLLSKAFK